VGYKFSDVEAELENLNKQLDEELNKIIKAAKKNNAKDTDKYIEDVKDAINAISGEITAYGYEDTLFGDDTEARKTLMELVESNKKKILEKIDGTIKGIEDLSSRAANDTTKTAWKDALDDLKTTGLDDVSLIRDAKNLKELQKAMKKANIDEDKFKQIDENLAQRRKKLEEDYNVGKEFLEKAKKESKTVTEVDQGITNLLKTTNSTKKQMQDIDKMEIKQLKEFAEKIKGAKDDSEIESKGGKKEWENLKTVLEFMKNNKTLSTELENDVLNNMTSKPEEAIKKLNEYLDKGIVDESKVNESLTEAKTLAKKGLVTSYLTEYGKYSSEMKVVDSSSEIKKSVEEIKDAHDDEEYDDMTGLFDNLSKEVSKAKALTEKMDKLEIDKLEEKIKDIKLLMFDRGEKAKEKGAEPDKDKILEEILKDKGITSKPVKPTEPSTKMDFDTDLKTKNPFSIQLKFKDADGNLQDFTFTEIPTDDMEFEVKPGTFEKLAFSKCKDPQERANLLINFVSKMALAKVEYLPKEDREAAEKVLEQNSEPNDSSLPARVTSPFARFVGNLPVIKQIGNWIEKRRMSKNVEPDNKSLNNGMKKIVAGKLASVFSGVEKYNKDLAAYNTQNAEYEAAEKEAETKYNEELGKHNSNSGLEEGNFYKYVFDKMDNNSMKAKDAINAAKKDILHEDDER